MTEADLIRKPFFWLSLALILLFIFAFSLPDNRLHIIFCQVGQGDAILINYKDKQILVDGGPNKDVLNCLGRNMPFWDRNLEMVILTHPEKDHFTGLIDVFENYKIDYFVSTEVSNNSLGFKEFQKVLLEENYLFYNPQEGDRIKIDSLEFLFLWPRLKMDDENYTGNSLNEISVVFQLSFKKFDVLFTGDISSKTEESLEVSEIEILKVGHHGSKYSTSNIFLDKIKPKLAVICVGKNSFGHPHPDALDRLKKRSIKTLRTDESEVRVITNGYHYQIFPSLLE